MLNFKGLSKYFPISDDIALIWGGGGGKLISISSTIDFGSTKLFTLDILFWSVLPLGALSGEIVIGNKFFFIIDKSFTSDESIYELYNIIL
jgi:hypothetical protein